MQSILTTTKEQEKMDLYGIEFPETVQRTYGKGDDAKTYTYAARALEQDDLFIAIRRDDRKENDQDGYRGTIELIIQDAECKDRGISATIYGPELHWRDEIRPAQVNWSAIGSCASSYTHASGELLILAAQIADKWTASEMPRLVKERKAAQEERAAAQAEREREMAAKKAWIENIGKTYGANAVVRVKTKDRKGFVIGQLGDTAASHQLLVHRNGKVEKFSVDKIEFVEGKDVITGKYANRINTEAI